MDLKNLPSYTDLIICDHIYQRYEDYHLVRNEMNKKNRIQLIRHDNNGKMYLYDIIDIKKETSNPLES